MSATKFPPRVKDRRKELILIALKHIAKRGFEGLRIHDVAMEAGINNATLHYYFPTKEDLIKGVVDFMIKRFSASAISTDKEEIDAWEEVLADFADARLRPREDPDQLVVYTELLLRSLHDPSTGEMFNKLDMSWQGILIDIIEKGIGQGVFRKDLDPKVTATLIMLQVKGMGLQILGDPNREIDDVVFDQLIRQIKSWLSGKDE